MASQLRKSYQSETKAKTKIKRKKKNWKDFFFKEEEEEKKKKVYKHTAQQYAKNH